MSAKPPDTDLKPFARNHYHHGQLLTEHSFNLEQYYFKEKIWLGNRLITGYGVVCGLDVKLGDDRCSVYVTPGIAIDKWGREIIVPAPTTSLPLPRREEEQQPPEKDAERPGYQGERPGYQGERPGYPPRYDGGEEDDYVHVVICFHECLSDPQPVVTSECDGTDACTPAIVRERYRVLLRPGKAPEIPTHCRFPDVIAGDHVDYGVLARWVTQECRRVKGDGCIPLATVRLPRGYGRCESGDIDISVRPIVYTNDLLFELIVGLMHEWEPRQRAGK
jgi:hypothetical protein